MTYRMVTHKIANKVPIPNKKKNALPNKNTIHHLGLIIPHPKGGVKVWNHCLD